MATKYWVGLTGTFSWATSSAWSLTPGGAGGAGVPTSADDVVFDRGNAQVNIGGNVCRNFTSTSGFTGIFYFSGTGSSFYCYGSYERNGGTQFSFGSIGSINYYATTPGQTIYNGFNGTINFNGVGGSWTLLSGISTLSGTGNTTLSLTAGTLNTNGQSVYCGLFSCTGSSACALNLGSSTFTIGGGLTTGTYWNVTNSSFTLNVGTSTLRVIGPNASLSINQSLYNLTLEAYSASDTVTLYSIPSVNNLTIAAPSAGGVRKVSFNYNMTIVGLLSTTSTASSRRVHLTSGVTRQNVITVNAAVLTDTDFSYCYITGAAAPISGTRIGNRGYNQGITFTPAKTVYWNLAGAQTWVANGWAATSGGAPNINYFPLPQDTAVFNNTGSVTGTISIGTAAGYLPTVDMSARTTAMTIDNSSGITIYGSWRNGTGTTISGLGLLTFDGGGTQTISPNGKPFSFSFTVSSINGTVQLAGALSSAVTDINIIDGTFDTAGYAVTCNSITANSNVMAVYLRSSVVTLTAGYTFSGTPLNLTLDAGTSQIVITSNSFTTTLSTGYALYDVLITNQSYSSLSIGSFTCRNYTLFCPSALTVVPVTLTGNITVSGSFSVVSGGSGNRLFFKSSSAGTTRTITANSFSATNCDFQDIAIAGAAAGSAQTGAGDLGGNSGITFPSPKTVYWNNSSAASWASLSWASTSGGVPSDSNFPLAQDTAIFDDANSALSVSISGGYAISTFNASGRVSSPLTITLASAHTAYGDWSWGAGCTVSASTFALTFAKRGTQTITGNGVAFPFAITIAGLSSSTYVQLGSALTITSYPLQLQSGSFDAVSYSVTATSFTNTAGNILKLGSGNWTLTGTGTVWNLNALPTSFYSGSAQITLSDTSTTARTFAGGSLFYTKLIIGGSTGISTTTITSGNYFGELASTKTVAHTIVFPSSTTTFIYKWSVTGTVGNVVTLAPSTASTIFTLYFMTASVGINYLSISYCTVSTLCPGEFYAGVNTTLGLSTSYIILSAAPAPRTLYWVGGTGNWTSTTKWSTSSGGASGAAIPTSLDTVIFNSASSAGAYTATLSSTQTLKCASLTINQPATGVLSFTGSSTFLGCQGSVFIASGVTSTTPVPFMLVGSPGGSYLFTTNGYTTSNVSFFGYNNTWGLGSALTTSGTATVNLYYTTFATNNYAISTYYLTFAGGSLPCTVNLGSSTIATSLLHQTPSDISNLTFNAGTSSITTTVPAGTTGALAFSGSSTYYNYSIITNAGNNITISRSNVFNSFSLSCTTATSLYRTLTLSANQTIASLTIAAGSTAGISRTFIKSSTLGSARTIAGVTSTNLTDVDFQDITITGAAAPVSGTRLGDAEGNSGITFPAAKTVYSAVAGSQSWGSNVWSDTIGGAVNPIYFPLPQDTAYIPPAANSGASTLTMNFGYTVGSIDTTSKTGADTITFTLTAALNVIGSLALSNTLFSGAGALNILGRGTQNIAASGISFPATATFSKYSGALQLQSAFAATGAVIITGTSFTDNGYSITAPSVNLSGVTGAVTLNGVCTVSGSGVAFIAPTTLLGNGTISFTSASSKSISTNNVVASGITLNNAGAGTFGIGIGSAGGVFKDISNTYSAIGAASINPTYYIKVSQFTAAGAAGKVLTISSIYVTAKLILLSGTVTTPYVTISGVTAYPTDGSAWYAGTGSTASSMLGWTLPAYVPPTISGSFFPFFS